MSENAYTMVAALGGQPQVVTFTLDLLLQRFPISDLVVVHPRPVEPRLQHSIKCLDAEFVGDCYKQNGQTIHYRRHILRLDDEPLDDIVDDRSATGVLNTIHALIRDLKMHHRHIHLSVTGGRRLMSLLAISAAMLNFDHADHIWHIYTPAAVRERADEGKLMHVSLEDGVQLIEMPYVPWGAYFPHLPQLPDTSAQGVLNSLDTQMDNQKRAAENAYCKQVMGNLTERQRDVLIAFADGLSRKEVAERLQITPSTVDDHKTAIFDECRAAWGLADNEPHDHTFLKEHFAGYLATNDEYTPMKKKNHRKGVAKNSRRASDVNP